jgi:alpha-beta hydrolase superfamily lysophospholipase
MVDVCDDKGDLAHRPSRRAILASGGIVGSLGVLPASGAQPMKTTIPAVRHKRVKADGVDIFYREAGREDAPVLLLLHGFANSSFYFRHLMPLLADRFRLIAPDIPSFGFTEVPAERNYQFTFASLSKTITAFVDALGLKHYILYVFDYGAPAGWDLALTYPDGLRASSPKTATPMSRGWEKKPGRLCAPIGQVPSRNFANPSEAA